MFSKWLLFAMLILSSTLFAAAEEENELSLKQMLLTPGELSKAHANLDNKCNQCHVHFDKLNQTPLCLDCHEKIAEDLETNSGFHSNLKANQTANCNGCHSDHLGRDADIVGLDRDQFDHNLTDFKLKGAHQALFCEGCHKASTKLAEEVDQDNKGFRISKQQCADCHVDVHDGAQGEQCSDCHVEESWKENKFDHNKTDFPLNGEHLKMSCESCHRNQKFEKGRTECVDCHLGTDKHLGGFGTECKDCHQESSWQKTIFEHFRDANFKLAGKHASLNCETCHRKDLPLDLPTECSTCHQADDIHSGSNGDDCSQCHNEKSWKKVAFDHNSDTDFKLNGAHKKTQCEGCHNGTTTAIEKSTVPGLECNDCHRAIDPHLGKLGKSCENCHSEISWNKDVRFSHDYSEFPLTGAHQNILCGSCHQDKQFSNTPGKCETCHLGDDVHNATLGTSCVDCHNTSLWQSWSFDHATKTRFELQGAHQNLSCDLCHVAGKNDPLKPDMRCASCHQQDDIHHGDFGPDCQQCHGSRSFDDIR